MDNQMDLFGDLGNTMDFLQDKQNVAKDGIYRVDLKKAKEGKWRSVIRFLPNFTNDSELVKKYGGPIGPSAIEKITHYVNIKNLPELTGYYDSPKNFGDKCVLSETFYNLKESKNAILRENTKMLNYSKKYFSYVLVVEDQQQPELVGKIMIFQYGKTIKDKISQEAKGEITGVPVNPFDLSVGKNFTLIVKEIDTGDSKYPDYKSSQFQPNSSSIMIKNNEGLLKNVPLDEVSGKIKSEYQEAVRKFMLDREYELEDYAPKRLSEDEQGKVSEIIAYVTGKTSGRTVSNDASPSENDFSLDHASGSSEEPDDFNFDLD
jgi:hypothetical protein